MSVDYRNWKTSTSDQQGTPLHRLSDFALRLAYVELKAGLRYGQINYQWPKNRDSHPSLYQTVKMLNKIREERRQTWLKVILAEARRRSLVLEVEDDG